MAHVLIVDDDAADRTLLRGILLDAGHELYFATNGQDAMRVYMRQSIDVVVTDLQMPLGDGLELITGLLGMYPDAAIIAISGKRKDELDVARAVGARVALPKPIDRAALLDAIEVARKAPAAEPGESPSEA